MLRSGKALAAAVSLSAALLATACTSGPAAAPSAGSGDAIVAVGAENEYANVIQQVGGKYVRTSAIMSNPNTDPHTFEASTSVARQISSAQLVVQNGLGYDTFMTTIEDAVPDSEPQGHRRAESARPAGQHAESSPVVQAVDDARGGQRHRHRSGRHPAGPCVVLPCQRAHLHSSLAAWNQAIASFRAKYPNTPVAVTEPVADYMLQAAGTDIMTPFPFQADIMNGVDPSAQDITLQRSLFTQHKVRVFLYNQQVTDSLTAVVHLTGEGERRSRRGRLRDHAGAGLRLSVLDAGGDARSPAGRGHQEIGRETVMAESVPDCRRR